MATKKIKRFQEGGMSDKDRGLEASKDEKVGFFERLRMGNIDDPSSEAYRRFGAGRGKAERTPVEDRIATPVARPAPAAQAAPAAVAMDEMEEANKREPISVSAGKRAEPSAPIKAVPKAAPKTAPKATPKADTSNYSNEVRSTPTAKRDTSNYSNEGRGREMTKEQQFARADAEARSPEGVARRKKQEAEQGLERVTPETALLPGGGLRAMQSLAKKFATPKMAKYSQEALPAPTKRLTYDKAGAVARKRAERAEARKSEMLKENAKRYGLDESSPGYEAAAGAVRKELGGKDFALKRGGSVKKAMPVKKMASGGSVSNPSKRADGIAIKGNTRCKMR